MKLNVSYQQMFECTTFLLFKIVPFWNALHFTLHHLWCAGDDRLSSFPVIFRFWFRRCKSGLLIRLVSLEILIIPEIRLYKSISWKSDVGCLTFTDTNASPKVKRARLRKELQTKLLSQFYNNWVVSVLQRSRAVLFYSKFYLPMITYPNLPPRADPLRFRMTQDWNSPKCQKWVWAPLV